MTETGFHFAAPYWLLLLLVPLAAGLWLRYSANLDDPARYRAYADPHLLPFLLGRHRRGGRTGWWRLLPLTLAWTMMVLALATPRWGYEKQQLFRSGIDLVVLLDLSSSMNATDVAPSRLARARQEIEDLISENKHSRIGLIAFASLAHVISPLTDDGATLLRQLPALTTDLVRLKGSRLQEALLRAEQMLAGSPKKSSRHVLLVTDGEFADEQGAEAVLKLAVKGIHVHALGIGTSSGAPVVSPSGAVLRYQNGDVIRTHLTEKALKRLADVGNGIYRTASFRNNDTTDILEMVERNAHVEALKGQTILLWNERFYWPLAFALLFLLPLFRIHESAHAGEGQS